jgi:hypothetical protein
MRVSASLSFSRAAQTTWRNSARSGCASARRFAISRECNGTRKIVLGETNIPNLAVRIRKRVLPVGVAWIRLCKALDYSKRSTVALEGSDQAIVSEKKVAVRGIVPA